MSNEEVEVLVSSIVWIVSALYLQLSKNPNLLVSLKGKPIRNWRQRLPIAILLVPFLGLALSLISSLFYFAHEICWWAGSFLLAPFGKIVMDLILPRV